MEHGVGALAAYGGVARARAPATPQRALTRAASSLAAADVRHVRKQYYQVWGPRDFAKNTPGRDAAVRVDTQRLEKLIGQALHDMQPW